MVLTHDDLSAIEASLGPEKAFPIVSAFEKLEREQKFEIKKNLLMELATKADLAEFKGALQVEMADLRSSTQAEIAEVRSALQAEIAKLQNTMTAEIADLRSSTQADNASLRSEIQEVKGDVKRLEMFLKVLIGLVVVAMGFFSPVGVELIKLLK